MASTLLVVDDLSDWSPYYPSEQVITFENYLAIEQGDPDQRVRIINLCSSYAYLSDGYYCSLLPKLVTTMSFHQSKSSTIWAKTPFTACSWKI